MKHIYRMGLMKGLFAIVLLAGTASCVDYQDAPAPVIPDGKEVQVELSFGFADEEDGYDFSETTRAGGTAAVEAQSDAFVVTPTPKVRTRSGETTTEITQPDALYELHVIQYTQAGGLIGSVNYTTGATTIGEKLTFTLTQADNCQLVIFARGQGNTKPSVSGNLSNFQSLIMPSEVFKNIPTSGATQSQMNKMPYILHLPHVNVTSDGKLQSLTGAHDARLLLKRLAVKLTVNWKMSDALTTEHYGLKEVKLCQVPVDFRILPTTESTEWGTTYPLAVSEFGDTYRITDATELAARKQTVWIPANVRGSSAKATSPYYRTKENAPDAASYVELVVDNSVKQERLYYRAYLGGKETTDFNLKENTDYDWTLTVNSANYRTDGRIQLLDQTPVVSTNLVPTSNCLMMKPGTNICFNPYKHEAGTSGWNTYLTDGTTLKKTIASVKVLWQAKDAGTSGDLVMGYAIDDTHHENLVHGADLGDKDKALVHVKVPVTNGGNAVIAAYAEDGKTILWSWHIWVSEYVPHGLSGTITADNRDMSILSAKNETQNGTVHTYGGVSWTAPTGSFYNCVIMDRNLGATRAGIQKNLQDAVRTFGLLYQGRRKDPFFSTADGTASEVNTIYDYVGRPIAGGVIKNTTTQCTLEQTIQNPSTFYSKIDNTNYTGDWGGESKKTLYDPCPKGWRVPSANSSDVKFPYSAMIAGFGSTNPQEVYGPSYQASYHTNIMYYNGKDFIQLSYANRDKISSTVVGSGFIYFGNGGENPDNYTENSAYFPGVSLREGNGNYRERTTNNTVFSWYSTKSGTYNCHYEIQYDPQFYKPSGANAIGLIASKANPPSYGFSVRCVQDRIQAGKAP